MKQLFFTKLKFLSFLPSICILCMIFQFSAQNGSDSGSLSLKITQSCVSSIDTVFHKNWDESKQEEKVEQYHFYVRKLGHTGEYFLLALSLTFPLFLYGLRKFSLILSTILICIFVASFDEYHQSFVAGRSPSVRDVFIDTFGASLGILFTQAILFIKFKIKSRKNA